MSKHVVNTDVLELNSKAIDMIESETVKHYLRSIAHVFSIEEQISIIWNSSNIISDKMNLFNSYLENQYIPIKIKNKLRIVIADYEDIKGAINDSDTDIVLKFNTTLGESKIAKDINSLSNCLGSDVQSSMYVQLLNTNTCKEYGSIIIDKAKQGINVINFSVIDNYEKVSGLLGHYVIIPNEFKIGDRVRDVKDVVSEYIVVETSDIPKSMRCRCDYTDTSLTVVPVSALGDNKTKQEYIEQINSIYEKRIHSIHSDNDAKKLDIISKYHDHIHLTLVEAVD